MSRSFVRDHAIELGRVRFGFRWRFAVQSLEECVRERLLESRVRKEGLSFRSEGLRTGTDRVSEMIFGKRHAAKEDVAVHKLLTAGYIPLLPPGDPKHRTRFQHPELPNRIHRKNSKPPSENTWSAGGFFWKSKPPERSPSPRE
jgi:hypothetical protein